MRDATRDALKLFVKKAKKLLSGGFVTFLQEHGGTSLQYTYKKDAGVTIEHIHPDDDAIDAFVLTFRFFIQENERISFRWLANNVLDDDGLSEQWKQEFVKVRDSLNTFLDSNTYINERFVERMMDGENVIERVVSEQFITHRELMLTFVYGGLAHANQSREQTYERWEKNTLAFPVMQKLFDDVLVHVLQHIDYVRWLSEQELAA